MDYTETLSGVDFNSTESIVAKIKEILESEELFAPEMKIYGIQKLCHDSALYYTQDLKNKNARFVKERDEYIIQVNELKKQNKELTKEVNELRKKVIMNLSSSKTVPADQTKKKFVVRKNGGR